LPRTNGVAYFAGASLTMKKKKSFITLVLGSVGPSPDSEGDCQNAPENRSRQESDQKGAGEKTARL